MTTVKKFMELRRKYEDHKNAHGKLKVEAERLRSLVKDPAMCGVELSEENDRLIDERNRLRAEVKQLREELEMWKNSHSPA